MQVLSHQNKQSRFANRRTQSGSSHSQRAYKRASIISACFAATRRRNSPPPSTSQNHRYKSKFLWWKKRNSCYSRDYPENQVIILYRWSLLPILLGKYWIMKAQSDNSNLFKKMSHLLGELSLIGIFIYCQKHSKKPSKVATEKHQLGWSLLCKTTEWRHNHNNLQNPTQKNYKDHLRMLHKDQASHALCPSLSRSNLSLNNFCAQ